MKPLAKASISFGTTGSVSWADRYGHFKIKKWWLNIRNQSITVSARGLQFTFKPKLKNQLTNFLFIQISNDGCARIFCLNETEKGKKASNIAILIHGFGIDIGPFTLSRHGNNWEDACNLFKTDPDLSDYDFYMLDHWDDESLVNSSFELACFLRIARRVYGKKSQFILLGHSAGGLIARHYTVSKFFVPGTVDRFLMLATPNDGSLASLLHFEPSRIFEEDMDGDGSASTEIMKGSDFLNCLNNKSEMPLECKRLWMIDKTLQDYRGLNPDIPCAILAGEVKMGIISYLNRIGTELESAAGKWLGKKAEDWVKRSLNNINKKILDKIPEGDILISLKSQLIQNVPFQFLPYPHGFINIPDNREDPRYLAMKEFILTDKISHKNNTLKGIAI